MQSAAARRKQLEFRARRFPDFPRMPSNPQGMFREKFYHEYKKDHPDAEYSKILEVSQAMWKAMTEEAVYVEQDAQLREENEKALDLYIEIVEKNEREKKAKLAAAQTELAQQQHHQR